MQELTGASGFTTCPLFYLKLPWVRRAAKARQWLESGSIREREGWPSQVLIEAIDAIDEGVNASRLAEEKRRKEKDGK